MKSNLKFLVTTLLFTLLIVYNNVSAQGVWVRQNSGTSADLYGVHFINDDEGYVVGDSGVFLKTKDNGINWSKKSLGDYVFRAVQFIDSSNGYVVGYNSSGGVVLKTTDGGNRWDTTTTNGLCLALHFMNKDTGIVVGYGRLIVKTTDGGNSWLDLAYNHGVNTSRFISDICFVNDTVGFIASGDCGMGFPCPEQLDYLGQISKTTDGGDSWNAFLDFGTYFSVSFGTDLIGFSGGWGIARTRDSGDTWNRFDAPIVGNGLFFVSPDTGWIAGPANDSIHGIIAVTINGGDNWIIEDTINTGELYHIFFSGKNYGWAVGTSGTILKRTGITSVRKSETIPSQFTLYQNHPNPFNPTTTINYSIKESGKVKLIVYDSIGRRIAVLVNKEQPAGKYEVTFDTRDYSLSSGIYYYQLIHNNNYQVRKMLLLR